MNADLFDLSPDDHNEPGRSAPVSRPWARRPHGDQFAGNAPEAPAQRSAGRNGVRIDRPRAEPGTRLNERAFRPGRPRNQRFARSGRLRFR